ncbi:MAG: UDP-N-acetylmuramoyl-tripeptide--D-alanyl-D-alanine ligase [Clostridia bacterium]|nr:UDP-N-acetylmuramoyl-tripeptide--D-alanyl-D-alanine ligase [Clostridia bacterium]
MKITLNEICSALGGELFGNGEKEINRVSFDSRNCSGGTLFAALKGEVRDGHDFVPSLEGSGAAALCSRKTDCNVDCVMVADVGKALCDLARWFKQEKTSIRKTVAVTGSVGKTTTKDMTACVLSKCAPTHKTQGNYNNNIGVPMTLFGIQDGDEILVCEMGMNNFGEISLLTDIAHPDIALITNIGTSHIENLGSRENICKAKMEIIQGMKPGSTLILNGDEPLLRNEAAQYADRYKLVFAGLSPENDIYADNVICGDVCEFDIHYENASYHTVLSVPGEHNVYNAVMAFGAGIECGMKPKEIVDALFEFVPHGMRQSITLQRGVKIFADCYNASRESMCAALKVLCSDANASLRKIAVLGEMRELGEKSAELHYSVGECVAMCRPDILFTLGDVAAKIEIGATENGFPKEKCINCATSEELTEKLANTIRSGDIVLFKASRLIKLEEIIRKLGFEI